MTIHEDACITIVVPVVLEVRRAEPAHPEGFIRNPSRAALSGSSHMSGRIRLTTRHKREAHALRHDAPMHFGVS